MRGKGDKKGGTIVIRKEEVVEGGHHGGAWKVAYADFVTAMMAFFLLMWLLNATTEEQRKGLADYFTPSNLISHSSSGSGQPFGGHTPFDDGAMVSDRGTINVTVGNHPPVDAPDPSDAAVPSDRRGARSDDSSDPAAHRFDAPADGTSAAHLPGQTGQDGDTTDTGAAARERQERRSFEKAAQDIREAVRNDPALTDVMKQLAIDMTPEGLRIQLLDDDHQPMFSTGSAALNDRARLLLQKIAPVLMRMPESISIAGHTDATPFAGAGRTNWELSSERANATRRLLTDSGLPEMRVRTVTGNADRDPLLPNDPLAAANRRIAIVVLRAARPVAPASRPQP